MNEAVLWMLVMPLLVVIIMIGAINNDSPGMVGGIAVMIGIAIFAIRNR